MLFTQTLKTSLTSLRTNKVRSFLTILGIVIGVTSIILITAIGEGAQGLIIGQLSGMGGETIIIRPGREPKGPMEMHETMFSNSLKVRDVEALQKKENAPNLASVVPSIILNDSVSYKGETYKPIAFGSSAKFLGETLNLKAEEGELFGDEEIKQNAAIVVIGQKVKKELFGDESALNKNIKIRGKNFRVTGVLPTKGQSSFFNPDEAVILPYTTAQSQLSGTDYYHEVAAKAKSPEAVTAAIEEIKATLRENHNITDTTKDDFFVVTQQGMIDQISAIMNILTLFLSAVVAISLVVGGIGVMNIMLVSVTERTREIGLRKSVGATEGNILSQFLAEAVCLTAMGGLASVILGAGLSYAAAIVINKSAGLDWPFVFPISAAFLGFGVSAAVGLVFGLYPAWKAAKKDPIEALRYE